MKRWTVLGICLTLAALMTAATLSAEEETSRNSDSTQTATGLSMRHLWQAGIQAPNEKAGSDELKKAILRVRGIRLPIEYSRHAAPTPTKAQKAPFSPTSQPNRAPTTRPARKDPEALSKKLKGLSPGQVAAPAALAESLFQSGHLDSAALFYQVAAANESETEEKAWLLFQAANCRRKVDPPAAAKLYGELVASYPSSPWSSVAKMQMSLIGSQKLNGATTLLKDANVLLKTIEGQDQK